MSQKKSTREERNSMLEDITLFKAVCADMSWDYSETPQKSYNSSYKKQAFSRQEKQTFANLSITTTLQDESFFKEEKNVNSFIELCQDQKRAIRKQKSQEVYEELKSLYLQNKQRQRKQILQDLNSIILKNIQKQIQIGENKIKIQEIKQNEVEQSKPMQQTKLKEQDELVLILKFLLGSKANSISWGILPITEEEGYAYIEKNYSHLKQLCFSKLDIYMKNIVSLYLNPNKRISTMFFMLFEKYGMKFDIYNQEPDFIRQTVKKGMFGTQFIGVPYLKQKRDYQSELE